MTTDVLIPSDLWDGDEECVITAWLSSDGATVREGALIAEIMTAKVQYEITAPTAGALSILKPQDAVVSKGAVIGRIV